MRGRPREVDVPPPRGRTARRSYVLVADRNRVRRRLSELVKPDDLTAERDERPTRVRPFAWLIDAFELVASQRVTLGPRCETRFDGLVHPIFSAGGVFGWQIV